MKSNYNKNFRNLPGQVRYLVPLFFSLLGNTVFDARAAVGDRSPVIDFGTCARPEYPKSSLRAEETGRTTLQFIIDVDGTVLSSAVVESSGHDALDEAALSALVRCRFTPGRVAGVATKATSKVQYVWTLDDATPSDVAETPAPQREYAGKKNAPQTTVAPGDVMRRASLADDANPGLKTDVTMAKITALLKASRYEDALPYFEQLERSQVVLPEFFYYYQIDTLYRTKNVSQTLLKSQAYLEKFGKKGRHYSEVISISAEFEIIADKNRKDLDAELVKKSQAEAAYLVAMRKYNDAYKSYTIRLEKREKTLKACRAEQEESLNHCLALSKKAESIQNCYHFFNPDGCEFVKELSPPIEPNRP